LQQTRSQLNAAQRSSRAKTEEMEKSENENSKRRYIMQPQETLNHPEGKLSWKRPLISSFHKQSFTPAVNINTQLVKFSIPLQQTRS